MAHEKIKTRNSASSLTGLVVSLVLFMAIFFGTYTYMVDNMDSAGVALDSKYSDSYDNLSTSQAELEKDVEAVRVAAQDIKEAPEAWQQVINGFKGLGVTLKLFLGLSDTAVSSYEGVVPGQDFLPGWVLPLIFTGLLTFIVFLVIAVLKGEPKL